jgi:hypothetical protein
MLTNGKPSAVFRVGSEDSEQAIGGGEQSPPATLGLSIEPLELLDGLEVQKKQGSSFGKEKQSTIANPQKMLENLFNYLMSFATKHTQPATEYIPVNALQQW